MDSPQDHRKQEHLKIERLVRMVGELDEFERDLGIESSSLPIATPIPIAVIRYSHRWQRIAVAAILLLAAGAWMLWPEPPRVEPSNDVLSTTIPTNVVPDATQPPVEAPVHMVVAIYRGDERSSERCAECWCVEIRSANWGDGRNVNELEQEELVSGSVGLSCVSDPRRMVVIGLSGPATAMPRTDEQALELSLCLIGEKNFAVGDAAEGCIPKGLDYCMADWARSFP